MARMHTEFEVPKADDDLFRCMCLPAVGAPDSWALSDEFQGNLVRIVL